MEVMTPIFRIFQIAVILGSLSIILNVMKRRKP